jgi:hypothetical protein
MNFLLSILLLGFTAAGAHAPTTSITAHFSPLGLPAHIDSTQFEVEIPSRVRVKHSADTTTEDFGVLIQQSYRMTEDSISSRSIALFLNINDFPFDISTTAQMDTMIAGTRIGTLKTLKASVTNEKRIDGENFRGVEMTFTGSPKGKHIYARYRWTMVGPRLYTLGFWSYDESDLARPEIDTFFSSFRVK